MILFELKIDLKLMKMKEFTLKMVCHKENKGLNISSR